jgi:glucokinase
MSSAAEMKSARKGHGVTIIGAVDIGGTKIAVGAVTEDGTIISQTESSTRPELGFENAMRRVKAMLHQVASCAEVTFNGIGIACPGPLDPFSGILDDVGTLSGWQGGNLIEGLASEFGIPVALENDADAAALAEAHWGAGKGSPKLIYITVSTGIGGGVVLAGELYRGARGAHPEIGHQIIDASGPPCYCKGKGCWESLASGSALESWMQEQHPVSTPRTGAEIGFLAEQGDLLALRAMEREGYYLGLGLANIITLFIPETVVLGGGVMRSSHLFLPKALEVVHDLCTQVPVKNTFITAAGLHPVTGLAGAAQAWFCRYARA